MKNTIEKLKPLFYKYKSQILYLFFGGLSTLLNIIIFFVLNTLFKIEYQISNVIAWIIVVIFAYITNKIWVFESKTTSKKDLLRETISFMSARVITLVIEFILLYLFIEKLFILEILAKIIINVIVIVLNYIFSKLFIFNNKKKFNTKKIISPIIILAVIITIISIMLYRYDINENGYIMHLASVGKVDNSNLSIFLGKESVEISHLDTLKQKIIIDEDNPKYMYIHFNTYGDNDGNDYVIQVIDNNDNIVIDKKINENYIYNLKYKLDIDKLSKGEYTLSITYLGDDTSFAPTYSDEFGSGFYINDKEQKGSLDVVIVYSTSFKFIVLYFVIAGITATYLVLMYIMSKYKNISLQNKFLILAIPIYLMYLILIPPTNAHDERYHWYRVFEITEGGFTSQIEENKTGYVLPSGAILNVPWVTDFNYAHMIKNKPSIIDYSDKQFVENGTMAVYSPVQYLPQVIGVTTGKVFTNNSLIIFYIGRIFNLIACISILYLAIKKMPYLKKLIFLLAFIPIAIEGFTTLSGDGILIAVSYYFLAYILDIIDKNKKMGIKDYIILLALGIFIAFSKLVYIPLIGLLLLIPKEKFKSNKDMVIKLSIMILVLLTINIIWLKIANTYLDVYTFGKSKDQISFILSNPYKYLQIFIHSIEVKGIDLFLQGFGKYLLWNEVIVNDTLVPVSLIIVSFIIIFNENTKKINKKLINTIMLFIILLIIALIFTSIFIQWTRFGTDIIYGVQGRYFLPILPLIFILLSNVIKNKMSLKEETLDKIVIYTCLFVSYMTVLQFIVNFL